MKNIIQLLIVFCSLIAFAQEDYPSSLEEMKLVGKVKSVKESKYKATENFGVIVKRNLLKTEFYVFNFYGQLKEKNEFTSTGELEKKYIFEFNTRGKCVSMNRYNPNGSLFGKMIYHYDATDKVNMYTVVDEIGNMKFRIVYVYNKKGMLKSETLYKNDANVLSFKTYENDAYGNVIVENYFADKKDLQLEKTTYEYDKKGNLIKKGNYKIKKEKKLDKFYLVDQISYVYKYDKNFNWTQKVIYKNNVPQEIVEREIIYF
ncbi:hypothetical protein [Aureivirga marina]|uniref:hypothetical protein n=1 Tax=Aureivirga marina TaxID=1182451 RepID=UPI0018CB7C53|nr:hypothetical protein [Aureivirga marina]